MNEIRILAGNWRRIYGRGILNLVLGRNPFDGRIQMSLDEFESLLYEPGRDGWLFAEVIEATLRLRVNALNQRTYIMPAYAWAQ
jgi:hypothetical protein